MKRHLLVLLLLSLVATSCSGGQITRTQGNARIWLHESDLFADGMDAIVLGTLMYDSEARCMYLVQGEAVDLVVWPAGTKIIEQDPVVLRLRGGAEATEGDTVSGGGGYVSIGRFDDLIPPECSGSDRQVAAFNADSDLTVSSGD